MFLWKNAVVLIGLLGMATLPTTMLFRAGWEKRYIARLVFCAALIACVAVSFLPMPATQLLFALLLISCFDRRVPMAATLLFFFFWTPSAGSLLVIAGAYIGPLTPFMAFSGALLIGYLVHPDQHLRRRFVISDALMLAFVLSYCVCISLSDTPTGIARNFATYFVPFVLSYHVLSRVRIGRPELVLRLMVFGATAAGLLCIFETVRHWPLYSGMMAMKHEMWAVDTPRAWLERGGVLRAHGPFSHPLTGGVMLGLAAIAAWGLFLIRGRSWPLLAVAVAILFGLTATLSRSGVVALAIGLIAFQLLRGRYLLAVLISVVGLLVVVGLPILGGQDARFSADYRLDLVTGVPSVLGSRVWLGYPEAIGKGLLDAFIQGQGIVDMVNTYLAIVVYGGVVSLIPFMLFLLSTYPHYRAIRRARPDPEQLLLAQALVAIQSALIVAHALLSAWGAPMQISFMVTALMIALRAEVGRVRAPEAARPVPEIIPHAPKLGEKLPMLR